MATTPAITAIKAPENFTVDGEGAALLRIQFVDTGDATTITIQRPTSETTINGEARDTINGETREDDDTLRLSFDAEFDPRC